MNVIRIFVDILIITKIKNQMTKESMYDDNRKCNNWLDKVQFFQHNESNLA